MTRQRTRLLIWCGVAGVLIVAGMTMLALADGWLHTTGQLLVALASLISLTVGLVRLNAQLRDSS